MYTTTLRAAAGSLGDQWDNAYDMSRVAQAQVQMNRYAANHAPKWAQISSITGGVGPQTIALFNRIKAEGLVPALASIASTRDGISARAGDIAGYLVGYGNDHGWNAAAPATIVTPAPTPSPSPSPTPSPTPGPAYIPPPPSTTSPLLYVAGAVAGLAVLYGAYRLSKGDAAKAWGQRRMTATAASAH